MPLIIVAVLGAIAMSLVALLRRAFGIQRRPETLDHEIAVQHLRSRGWR
jgi:hypothetical protein